MKPSSLRQTRTRDRWLFECHCKHCSRTKDAIEVFRCPLCHKGIVKAYIVDVPSNNPCSKCLRCADDVEIWKILAQRVSFARLVEATNRSNFHEIFGLYEESMRLYSQDHWISFLIRRDVRIILETLSNRVLDGSSDLALRIALLKVDVGFLKSRLPLPNVTSAKVYEDLGDCLVALGDESGARMSYESAHAIYVIVLGQDDPKTKEMRRKY